MAVDLHFKAQYLLDVGFRVRKDGESLENEIIMILKELALYIVNVDDQLMLLKSLAISKRHTVLSWIQLTVVLNSLDGRC